MVEVSQSSHLFFVVSLLFENSKYTVSTEKLAGILSLRSTKVGSPTKISFFGVVVLNSNYNYYFSEA